MNNPVDFLQVVTDWRQTYQVERERQGKSLHTLRADLQDLGAFAGWFVLENGEPFRPELLNSWDMRAYRTWCLEVAKVSPATWNRRRATLMVFCKWARKTGWITTDPMEDIPAYEMVEQAPRWLIKQEYGRLLRQIELNLNAANTAQRRERAVRDGALVATMLFGGLRESEACALRLGDLELGAKKGKLMVRLGKGQKSREVPLNSEARRWLSEWVKILGSNALDQVLFPNAKGGELGTRAVEKRIRQIGEQAGVEGLYPHQLRHTCAKRMVDSGVPLTVVQRILGHARIEMTARYAMAGWDDMVEAVEAGILGKARRSDG